MDIQHGFESFEAFGVFAHACVVDWVTLVLVILLGQDGAVAGEQVVRVLLEDADHLAREFEVPLYGVGVVLDCVV